MSGGGTAGRPRLSVPARTRLGLALVALLVAFVVLAIAVGAHATSHLDARAIAWMSGHRTDGAVAAAKVLGAVGAWYITAPLVVAAAVLLVALRRRRDALYLVITVATAAGLNAVLKVAFRRPRPFVAADLPHPSSFAFPSGHTMSATALAAALVFIAWPTRWRTPVLAAGVLYALLMGAMRVVLTVHWPTDVVAGWLLGTAVAVAVRLAMTRTGGGARAGAGERAVSAPVDVVFLDWGGTLMVDDGTQSGPMATWPEVAAVEGAHDALQALRPHYRLVVATNADDSSERDVRAALFRAGLDALLDGVVSSRDIGVRKPNAFFYRAALLRVGRGGVPLPADRAVMVGDSWANDVAGAHAAGLRTVWFNPRRSPRPAGAAPPDAEVVRLADLPAAVAALPGAAPASRGRSRSGEPSL